MLGRSHTGPPLCKRGVRRFTIIFTAVFHAACALSPCTEASAQQSQPHLEADKSLNQNNGLPDKQTDGNSSDKINSMPSSSLHKDNANYDNITTRQQVIYSVTLEKPRYPVPGTTSANIELQKDILANLASHESRFGLLNHENCKKHIIVTTKVLKKPSKYTKNITTERWDVDRCGKIKYYVINLIPNNYGGTFIKIPNLNKYK